MRFKPFTPKNTAFPVKFYSTEQGISLGKRGSGVTIDAPDQFTFKRVEKLLLSHNIDINTIGLRELGVALQEADLIETSRGHRGSPYQKTAYQANKYQGVGQKSVQQLVVESNLLDLNKPPFRDETINEVSVIISSNEPPHIADLFRKTKLNNINAAHLPVADIIATNKDGDTLFIERKTIRDLNQSVITNARSHDQSERLFDEVMKLRRLGKRAVAVWIIESMPEGPYLASEALQNIQNVDGLLNYFTMINDQPTFQTFSTQHTIYMSAKLIQGFFEQKLFKGVTTTNPQVTRSKKERIAAKQVSAPAPSTLDSGVTRHTSDKLQDMLAYIPGITTKTAKALAETGKTLSKITQMSEEELVAIHGIGAKSASRIFQSFNTTN